MDNPNGENGYRSLTRASGTPVDWTEFEPGQGIEGVFIGLRTVPAGPKVEKAFEVMTLELKDGKRVSLKEVTKLTDLFDLARAGELSEVKITLIGLLPSKFGKDKPMFDFDVEVK